MTERERELKTDATALLQEKDHLMSKLAAQTSPVVDSVSWDQRCHKPLLSQVSAILLQSYPPERYEQFLKLC